MDVILENAKVQLQEAASSGSTMSGNIATLNKDKKELMTELLESVKTENLEKQFNKYLPSVLNEEVAVRAKKEVIQESVTTEHTGNRSLEGQTGTSSEETKDVVELDVIRKLAGLK
jgi:uncharacterized protein (DUF2225 family)